MMAELKTTIAILVAALCGACSGGGEPEQGTQPPAGAHQQKGPHGGPILEVGDHVAHLEVLHDETAGEMTIHVFGADLSTPLALVSPPEVKVMTAAGPKVLETTAQDATDHPSSVFTVTDDALKGHAEGRISVQIDGKTYSPELLHDH